MITIRRITITCCWMLLPLGLWAQETETTGQTEITDPAPTPGTKGDEKAAGWERIRLSGNTTFDDSELRNALLAETDFLFAAHPKGPASDLGTHARRLLSAGYRHAGFANVTVTASRDGDGLSCDIKEGQRYECADVVIHGSDRINRDALLQRLTEPFAKPDTFPRYFTTNGKKETRWFDKDGKQQKLDDPVWKSGKGVPFDSEQRLHAAVKKALGDLGFSQADFAVRIVADDAAAQASLHVDLHEEGPRDLAAKFVCRGLVTTTEDELLHALGLSSGVPIDRAVLDEINYVLWSSGRFPEHKVAYDAAGKTLSIEANEREGLPSLSRPISPQAEALLRAREWLGAVDDRGDDISMTYRRQRLRCHTVFSRRGMFAAVEIEPASGEADPTVLRLLADERGLAFDHSEHPHRLLVPRTSARHSINITNELGVADKPDQVFKFGLGLGFRSDKDDHAVVVNHLLSIDPAGWLPLAYHPKLDCRIVDGKLIAQSTKDPADQMVVDVETGAILRLRWADSDIAFDQDLFLSAAGEFDEANAGKPNGFDGQRPLTSVAQFCLSPPVWDTIDDLAGQFDQPLGQRVNTLVDATRGLVDAGALALPDRLAVSMAGGTEDDEFKIPNQAKPSFDWRVMLKQTAAKEILKRAPDCFGEGDWPLQLTREACLAMVGKQEYTASVLGSIYADPRHGPICHATVAQLLSLMNAPQATMFAERALQTLNEESFRRDYETLSRLPGGAEMMKSLAAFRALPPAQGDAILGLVSNESVREFLRTSADYDLADSDDAAAFWYRVSESTLRSSLERLR